jgi:hypothetical protein
MTKAAVPVGRLQLLNRVTSGAGEAVFVEAAIHLRVLRQRSRENPDGVMAAIAVPGELDALGAQQNVDAGAIEGRAKGVRVQRLAPLAVGFLMTASAIRSRQEGLRLNEIVAFDGRVARRRDFVGPEAEIVGRAYFGGVGFAVGGLILLRPGCDRRNTTRARE